MHVYIFLLLIFHTLFKDMTKNTFLKINILYTYYKPIFHILVNKNTTH